MAIENISDSVVYEIKELLEKAKETVPYVSEQDDETVRFSDEEKI